VLATADLKPGWFRIEIASVPVSREEATELREHDIILTDPVPVRTDRGEAGSATLVLSNGLRFATRLTLSRGTYTALIGDEVAPTTQDAAAINLVFREVDSRELPETRLGTVHELAADPKDPLTISWRDEIIASGEFVDVDANVGVRVVSRRPSSR
jgi:hypothetical protein